MYRLRYNLILAGAEWNFAGLMTPIRGNVSAILDILVHCVLLYDTLRKKTTIHS